MPANLGRRRRRRLIESAESVAATVGAVAMSAGYRRVDLFGWLRPDQAAIDGCDSCAESEVAAVAWQRRKSRPARTVTMQLRESAESRGVAVVACVMAGPPGGPLDVHQHPGDGDGIRAVVAAMLAGDSDDG